MKERALVIAVIVVGLLTTLCIGGVIAIILDEKSAPDSLIALAGVGMAAVGGLVSRPMGGTQDVRVVDQPVDTVDVNDNGQVTWGGVALLCVLAFLLGWLAHQAGLFA